MRLETFSADEFGFEISYAADALECVDAPDDPRVAWALTALLPFGTVSPVLVAPHGATLRDVVHFRAPLLALGTFPPPTPAEVVAGWSWETFTTAVATWVTTATGAVAASVLQYEWHGLQAVQAEPVFDDHPGFRELYAFLADPHQTFSLLWVIPADMSETTGGLLKDVCDSFHLLPYDRERHARSRYEPRGESFLVMAGDLASVADEE